MLCTGSQVRPPSCACCRTETSPLDRYRKTLVSDYLPVSCTLHSMLELAILSKGRLRAKLVPDPSGAPARTLVLRPLDLSVSDRAEWLDALDAEGGRLRLRLDRIIEVQPCI